MSIEWTECSISQQFYADTDNGQLWVTGDGEREKLEFVDAFGSCEVLFEGTHDECKASAELHIDVVFSA